MLHTWFYVEDDLLLAIYQKVIKQGTEKDAIYFVFKEITNRNISPRNREYGQRGHFYKLMGRKTDI